MTATSRSGAAGANVESCTYWIRRASRDSALAHSHVHARQAIFDPASILVGEVFENFALFLGANTI